MRNILFLISLSQHKLFSQEYTLLCSKYAKMIEKYNLPIKIFGYKGGYDSTFIDHNTNILHLAVNDRDIAGKYYAAHQCIQNNPWVVDNYDYDVIMATNTSTFVNLYLLNKMIQDDRFDMLGLYGNKICVRTLNLNLDYPEGKLMVYSRDVRDKIISVWEKFSDNIVNQSKTKEDYMWATADDQPVGKCCQCLNIPIHDIPTSLKFNLINFGNYFNNLENPFSDLDTFEDTNGLSNTLFMVLKTAEYNFNSDESNKYTDAIRRHTECLFIKLAYLIYNHPFNDMEIETFLSRIYK